MRLPAIVLSAAHLLLTPSLAAQSSWCRYEPGLLAQVMNQHAQYLQEEALADTVPGRHFSSHQFPRRASVVYTGDVRELPVLHTEALHHYFGAILGRPLPPDLFRREVHVVEGGQSLWIPIQDQLLPQLESEAVPGDTVLLFVVWVGALGTMDGNLDWLFMVNEFGARHTMKSWEEELASCRR